MVPRINGTMQVLSMIHSSRPIVTPVANIVFCCFVFLDLKSGEGRTNNMCENNYPYRPWLWVGRVDQKTVKGKKSRNSKAFSSQDTTNKRGVINDPFGQAYSHASNENSLIFNSNFFVLLDFWKVGTKWGLKQWPLWVGRVAQKKHVSITPTPNKALPTA